MIKFDCTYTLKYSCNLFPDVCTFCQGTPKISKFDRIKISRPISDNYTKTVKIYVKQTTSFQGVINTSIKMRNNQPYVKN